MEFKAFPKMERWSNNLGITITEKIDGTNGIIAISDEGCLFAGSRNKWLTPESDNYGFCKWVMANAPELIEKLGPGYHYGEWWGQGIQRRYDMKEKVFSLFNVERWGAEEARPACCSVVPVLYRGALTDGIVDVTLSDLMIYGSKAAPGFNNPEGVVVYFHQTRTLLKAPFDQRHKWQQTEVTSEIL